MFKIMILDSNILTFCAKNFSLVGCTVSPGFKFEDFKLGDKAQLISQYPQHQQLINRLAKRN